MTLFERLDLISYVMDFLNKVDGVKYYKRKRKWKLKR